MTGQKYYLRYSGRLHIRRHSYALVAGFPAFPHPALLQVVSDRSDLALQEAYDSPDPDPDPGMGSDRSAAFQAAVSAELLPMATAAELLNEAGESETGSCEEAELVALRPAVSAQCLEWQHRFRYHGESHFAEAENRRALVRENAWSHHSKRR